MTEDAAAVRLPGVMWHVTLTLHGQPQEPESLAQRLQHLAFSHGVELAARYSEDTVEVRYWDEGQDCRVVVDHALDLWDAHREGADLPLWPVVGIEVLDRSSFRRRWPSGTPAELLAPGVAPMPVAADDEG